MQPSRSLFLLGALAQAATAFRFTGPSTDEPLDLSGPINITWVTNENSDVSDYATFNLTWHGNATAEENFMFSYYIAWDVLNQDGSWEWDPQIALQSNQDREDMDPHGFSEGRDYYFQATFGTEDGEATRIDSSRYEITNAELNAAGRAAVAPLVAMVGVAAAIYQAM